MILRPAQQARLLPQLVLPAATFFMLDDLPQGRLADVEVSLPGEVSALDLFLIVHDWISSKQDQTICAITITTSAGKLSVGLRIGRAAVGRTTEQISIQAAIPCCRKMANPAVVSPHRDNLRSRNVS
jgi:hypothetical protein